MNKMNPKEKWAAIGDVGEIWYWEQFVVYDTREEAVEAGRKKYPGEDFYVGKCESIAAWFNIHTDNIIDIIANQLFDREDRSSFRGSITRDMDKELNAALNKVVREWIVKHKIREECFVVMDPEFIDNYMESEYIKAVLSSGI